MSESFYSDIRFKQDFLGNSIVALFSVEDFLLKS